MIVEIVSIIFVVLSIAALAIFAHKVVWLVKYKRLQTRLIREANARIEAQNEEVGPDWEAFTAQVWSRTPAPSFGCHDAVAFAHYVENRLNDARVGIAASRKPVGPLLEEALGKPVAEPDDDGDTIVDSGTAGASVTNATRHMVLEVPSVTSNDPPQQAWVELRTRPLTPPRPPSPDLYDLKIRSRYGFIRRALVFVTGVADVIYSSQHLTMMSHYSHVPVGVILRRMSLIVILVLGIALQTFGVRDLTEPYIASLLAEHTSWVDGKSAEDIAGTVRLATVVLWATGVTVIYFVMAWLLRRRSRRHLIALETLREEETERLKAIADHHEAALLEWCRDFSEGLDASVELTANQLELTADHYLSRARRLLRGQELFDEAKRVSDALFQQLPESSDKLQDDALSGYRSLRHYLWPRAEEMADVIEIAQYRDAWQFVELYINEFRQRDADVEYVVRFWLRLVTYAAIFDRVVPADTLDRLRRAYRQMVSESVKTIVDGLCDFDDASRELVAHLGEQLASATPLLAARIELAEEGIRSDEAQLQAEIIRTRERARLEAMAFEI